MKPTRCRSSLKRLVHKALVCALALSSGCGWLEVYEWSDTPETTVWSDDGQRVAVVRYDFELKVSPEQPTVLERSAEQSTVYIASVDSLDDLRVIAPPLAGKISSLHFMRSEGYILSRREVDGEAHSIVVFESIGLGGKVQEISRGLIQGPVDCGLGDGSQLFVDELMVPSPDGKTLAWVRIEQGCDGVLGELQFIDADNLRPVGGPVSLLDALSLSAQGLPRFAWDTHGRFLVARALGVSFSALAYVPDIEPTFLGAIGWACFLPTTSSSWISWEGYGARMTRTGTLTSTDEVMSGVFGCGQIPD